jgi:hypothetical protein
MAHAGDVSGGAARVREAIESGRQWEELLARLPPELAPGAVAVRAELRER